MKHLFVPYEIAVMAKEKGFCEHTLMVWDSMEYLQSESVMQDFGLIYVPAPLYQQLIDWFREKHSIDIIFIPPIAWQVQTYDAQLTKKTIELPDSPPGYYQAFNKALTEAFKLI